MLNMIEEYYDDSDFNFDSPEGKKILDEEMDKIDEKVDIQMDRIEGDIKKAGCSKEK